MAAKHAKLFSLSVQEGKHEVQQDEVSEPASSAASVVATKEGRAVVKWPGGEMEIEGPFCEGAHFANVEMSGDFVLFDEVFVPGYTWEQIGLTRPMGRRVVRRTGFYDGRTFCLNVTEKRLLYANPFWWKGGPGQVQGRSGGR
ncbi:MAG: hypothetical protein ABIF82_08655 [Planctomycetota bacterium]